MENLLFLAHLVVLIVISPMISNLLRIPPPVVEIILGSLAVWVGFLSIHNDFFKELSKIGFFYLMFLAGLEIDIQKFIYYQHLFLKKALLYFFCLYSISFSLYFIFNLSYVYIVAIPIVSLGMIMALINQHGKEHKWLELSLIIGVLGELISISALVIFDGAMTHGLGWEFFKNIAFLILVLLSSYALYRSLSILFWWHPNIKEIIMPNDDKKHQSIRISIALFFLLIVTMQWLDIDMVLGAFIAGIFIGNFFSHKTELHHDLSIFGFGFLVPIFFVFVGTTLDINLIFSGTILRHAGWIVLAMVGARMVSSFLAYYNYLGFKDTILFSLGDSMPLTFLIAIATMGLKQGTLNADEYASFIIAALLEGIVIMITIQLLLTRTKTKIS